MGKESTNTTQTSGAVTDKPKTEPTKTTTTTVDTKKLDRAKKIQNIASIGSSVGTVAGLVLAYKQKKKFWGYVGYAILGSLVVGITAGVTARVLVKEEK